jgi:YbbR domain-containing protein
LRVLRFIIHNWPLKIGAVLLAVTLYGAMVVLQTTQQFPGTVAIDVVRQPVDSSLIVPKVMPEVSGIRYIAAADVPISQASFSASIDLSNATVSDTESSWVRVQLVPNDPRIQIMDYQPQQIRVTLDPIVHRQVAVKVAYGTPPAGLSPGLPLLSVSTVDVKGAASIVSKVAYAEARVQIDASGLDVSQDPSLVARDANGALVDNVTFDPRTVHVDIQVGSQTRSETVPVKPDITGVQAAGYIITSSDVTPPVVSVRGQADALALLKVKPSTAAMANTAAISIAGATSDVSAKVNLALPGGVTSETSGQITVVVHLQSPASTRSVTVGVVLNGARSDRTYNLSAPSVIVTLGGATAALNALDASTLFATASVAGMDVGAHTVTVSYSPPAGIRVVAIGPAQITVTITIAASSSPTPPVP